MITGDGIPGTGGGLANEGTVWLQNTILASNSGESGPECRGQLTSLGWNLVGDPRDCTIDGDLTGTRIDRYPRIGPLGDRGTHALFPTSPAIDAGDPSGCRDADDMVLATDQRGVPRTIGRRCDIGAYELGPCAIACPGDCDENGMVSVDELVVGVQLALGTYGDCSHGYDGDELPTIDKLLAAVRAALQGCPPCE